jgi:hypothetical protein
LGENERKGRSRDITERGRKAVRKHELEGTRGRKERERDRWSWEGTGGLYLFSTSSIGTFRFNDYSISIELL